MLTVAMACMFFVVGGCIFIHKFIGKKRMDIVIPVILFIVSYLFVTFMMFTIEILESIKDALVLLQ